MSAGAALVLGLGLTPAPALDSGWAETEGGRMRMVVDPTPREDGTIAGILDIDLDPGWKTYWRDPGGSGIPPTLDVSGSDGIALEEMAYPPPVRIDDGYAVWAGYSAPVQLPLIFRRTGSGDARIHALVFIGICEKICVPFQAEFTINLPEGTEAADDAKVIVAQAFGKLPQPAAADFKVETAVLDAEESRIEISAVLPQFRPSGVEPQLFVAGPPGFAFSQPKPAPAAGGSAGWTVGVEAIPAATSADTRQTLEIVITLGQRAIVQNVEIKGFSRK
ncbi:MAG: protein-disulfide reductase DsbD family protein [Hoeflea sp.]|uniref:protein-disulfide reductase DsbD domain-containing protein n=1 Tax=Hoeflea sp. TaxID=1940281 RepID=UPI0027304484|nr:protein-disulfide reductase DsbD domain-containing protein [Hoeflea sp.]MDP2119468.1 protein-disulfide reductase DsbD family protein [Hoeflea sp.]